MSAENASLSSAKRLVVKIGSALLVDGETGRVRREWLDGLADDVAALRAQGTEVVIVTSGAVAAGREHLGLVGRPLRLEEKQAAAATGQIRLAHAYQETLARHDVTVAQVLVTLEDTESRRRHLNARATIDTLLKLGAVPVINENDTVATAELRFGDNDRLAARVAQMISADTLVLLSDIDGLYTADPRKDPDAAHIPEVREVTAAGGRVLFVGTKRQAQDIIAESARKCGQYYVNHRWLGGMLTNWKTISLSIKRLRELEELLGSGEVRGLTKKEQLNLTREMDKLERALGGIKEMGGLPDVLFIIDVCKESLAVQEANKLGIPVIGVLDSNANPSGIDFPVPGNDDAIRAIKAYCDLMAGSVLDGIQAQMSAAGVDLGAAEHTPVEAAVAETEQTA